MISGYSLSNYSLEVGEHLASQLRSDDYDVEANLIDGEHRCITTLSATNIHIVDPDTNHDIGGEIFVRLGVYGVMTSVDIRGEFLIRNRFDRMGVRINERSFEIPESNGETFYIWSMERPPKILAIKIREKIAQMIGRALQRRSDNQEQEDESDEQ